jgi:hypothetical protein
MDLQAYVDGTGAYLGHFDQETAPKGATVVPVNPTSGLGSLWDGKAWVYPVPLSALIEQKLLAGLQITSTGTPALSARYSLDELTLAQIGSVARDAAAGLGLPEESASFTYPDLAGAPHDFSASAIQALYKAMRDFVSRVSRAQDVTTLSQISDKVTIP